MVDVEDVTTPEPASPSWVQLVAEINAEAEAAKAAAKIANESAIKAQSALNDLLQGIRDGDWRYINTSACEVIL